MSIHNQDTLLLPYSACTDIQMRPNIIASMFLLGCSAFVRAHPGQQEKHATRDLLAYKANMRRGLEKCAVKFEESGLSSAGYTLDTPESEIFGTSNTCTLNPEGETGPYFVKGEYLRTDVLEDQPGVPVTLEFQFVDVETCEPIPKLFADIWNCNATGVYSGLVAMGNGNSNDQNNMKTTFLRGVGATDDDGVVTFKTLFPGHYSGRTTHHHVVAHLNATVLANNTLSGGTVPHIGQLFWDQDLINAVEATSPYNTNDVTLTTNDEDRVFSDETAGTTSDPVINYVYLGDDLSDGLLGWVTIAVNQSATYSPAYSYEWTSSGSVAVSGHSGDSVNGGGAMPSGGSPSGSKPSGGLSSGGPPS
ncbi:Intradiol ring-cleavage dioxygenase [Aspergillus ambiguus]|uniref:intradiol ring-cleavage dioxygenase n=1 Tax=Aspergillus ambiguus TaxID=176160 RepID=UPI003CCDEF53